MNHMVTSLANTFKSPLVDTIQSILQHQQKTAETEEARTKKFILSSSLKCMGWHFVCRSSEEGFGLCDGSTEVETLPSVTYMFKKVAFFWL
ncbi:unnamed protein product [Brassica oleracea]|uniref:(rape) hypothetical protein n=1 Tax=Brassica napus TaxID=3708 RepID=A0A816JPA0_BRANA|nr:unnamed protein product [Brassica napus]